MPRYLIIGCSGSGKSTFARKLAESCDVPYHDADSLYWGKGWKLSSDEEVVASLPLDSDNWVIDGNFTGHRCEVWKRATSIVWLDFPVGVIMRQVIRRNLGWWISRKPSWSGSRMPLGIALSGIRHAWKHRKRARSNYPGWLEDMKHANVYRIRDHAELEVLLLELPTTSSSTQSTCTPRQNSKSKMMR
jgi:hypothetical protein